jgi:hypothetical protein
MKIKCSWAKVVKVTPFTTNIKNLETEKVPQAVRARPSGNEELEIRYSVK